jgi:hypothetical protein
MLEVIESTPLQVLEHLRSQKVVMLSILSLLVVEVVVLFMAAVVVLVDSAQVVDFLLVRALIRLQSELVVLGVEQILDHLAEVIQHLVQ